MYVLGMRLTVTAKANHSRQFTHGNSLTAKANSVTTNANHGKSNSLTAKTNQLRMRYFYSGGQSVVSLIASRVKPQSNGCNISCNIVAWCCMMLVKFDFRQTFVQHHATFLLLSGLLFRVAIVWPPSCNIVASEHAHQFNLKHHWHDGYVFDSPQDGDKRERSGWIKWNFWRVR